MAPPVDQLPEAFYLPVGEDRYLPTDATESPWDPDSQHGGPPAALLATVADRVTGAPGLRLARITAEMLGPIPKREVTVRATTTRPGRRVAMTDVAMESGGRPVVTARTWHIATGAAPPATTSTPAAAPPGPDTVEEDARYFPLVRPGWGYGLASEWRFTDGGWATPGPAGVWARPRIPLVAGTELTGLQRALIVADAANGLSGELPLGEWLFVPPSVTVHLLRHPEGPWVHLAARTRLGADGIGLTTGTLADEGGVVGVVDQPLLVAPAG